MEDKNSAMNDVFDGAIIGYDRQIARVRALLMEWGSAVREYHTEWRAEEERKNFMERIGLAERGRGRPTIVPGDETALELGHPGAASVNVVMWTDKPDLIERGAIHLHGPDIPEAAGRKPSYAQIVMLAVRCLADVDPFPLESAQYLSNRLPGYMVRMVPGRLWARVSHQAIKDGLNFARLGSALIAAYSADFPYVSGAEVLFVTSSAELVNQLGPLAAESRIITGKNKKLMLVGDGEYECTDLNCDTCDEKNVCDDIKDILIMRRKQKRQDA